MSQCIIGCFHSLPAIQYNIIHAIPLPTSSCIFITFWLKSGDVPSAIRVRVYQLLVGTVMLSHRHYELINHEDTSLGIIEFLCYGACQFIHANVSSPSGHSTAAVIPFLLPQTLVEHLKD